jgi:hypothetical protein
MASFSKLSRVFEEFESPKKIWHSAWVGAPLWLCTLAITVYWLIRPPAPGYAIGALGAVAGIMSVREIKTLGKISWVVLLVCLLITEFRAIDKDRKDSARQLLTQRSDQDTKFKSVLDAQQSDFAATAKGLEDSYQQSQREFHATMGGISRNVNTFTGGDSYSVLTYVPGQGSLVFLHKGDYPLFSISARIADLDNKNDIFGTVVEVGDSIRGHALIRPVPQKFNLFSDSVNLNIFFNARNGDWIEVFRARRNHDGQWTRAMLVEGAFSSMKKAEIVCETIDKGFPKGTLDKEFNQMATTAKQPPSCQ